MVKGNFLWRNDHCAGFVERLRPMENDGAAWSRPDRTINAALGAAQDPNPNSDTDTDTDTTEKFHNLGLIRLSVRTQFYKKTLKRNNHV